MTDEEFDLLDELYFVHGYQEIKDQLSWEDEMMVRTLKMLLEKEWIRCFKNVTEEIFGSEIRLDEEFQSYHYLATKAGLLAHNGR